MSHKVMEHKEMDGTISGYFCITCDDWVVPEHSQNTNKEEGKVKP